MTQALFRRILVAIPTFLVVTLVIFLLLQLAPGDPAVIAAGGNEATPEQIARARELLGLNDPVLIQYARMMAGYLTGDLGTSIFSSESVAQAIWTRLPVTLSLAVGGLAFGVILAVPAGILAAAKAGHLVDRAVMWFSTLGIASPPFFVALMLALVARGSFVPVTGYRPLTSGPDEWALHLILPCFTLGIAVAAELARHVRGAMRDVLSRDYVRTAMSKGVPVASVLGKHALKNASLPIITVIGLQFQHLLAGTVVIEAVFGLPGLGTLLVRAVLSRDFPMIQGLLLFIVVMVIVVNVLVDLSYALLNPKVRAA
jgi:peptide/nickel transport system permease protein